MIFGGSKGWQKSLEDRHKRIVDLVDKAGTGPIRPPWRLVSEFAVGGLEAIGFERNAETMLVASSNGQSVYDCLTGDQIYRNRQDDGYDWKSLTAHRLDHDCDGEIPMSGLHGGGLRSSTDDGWHLEKVFTAWPKAHLVLLPPNCSLWGEHGTSKDFDVIATEYDFRVWGFSWTGKTLVWSDEVDIRLYSRS